MATHPYISGPGSISQMIAFLKKNFPANVTSDTVKKLGIAPKNESYVINTLQFLKLIDENGKRTDEGHSVMTKHDEEEFQYEFENVIKSAYSDLFELRADDAWIMSKDQLIAFFRNSDKTSDIIGGRQAGVFIALRELAGHQTVDASAGKSKASGTVKPKATVVRKSKPSAESNPNKVVENLSIPVPSHQPKSDMALTVRIEINLPAEGTQETYNAIFKSIRENLLQ